MEQPQVIIVKDAPTKLVGSTIYLTNENQPVLLAGGQPPYHRKQIAISNPYDNAFVYVYAQFGGPIIQAIFPRTTWTFFASDDLYIAPSNTANFNVYIAQTFYV